MGVEPGENISNMFAKAIEHWENRY